MPYIAAGHCFVFWRFLEISGWLIISEKYVVILNFFLFFFPHSHEAHKNTSALVGTVQLERMFGCWPSVSLFEAGILALPHLKLTAHS